MAHKFVDIAEFTDIGFLQEVNRVFFHPQGMALVVAEDDDGGMTLVGIQDCRDDPEGMIFATIDPEKRARVAEITLQRMPARTAALGCWIQED